MCCGQKKVLSVQPHWTPVASYARRTNAWLDVMPLSTWTNTFHFISPFVIMILTDRALNMWSTRRAFKRTIGLKETLIPSLIPTNSVLSADYQLRWVLLFKSNLMKNFILDCKHCWKFYKILSSGTFGFTTTFWSRSIFVPRISKQFLTCKLIHTVKMYSSK